MGDLHVALIFWAYLATANALYYYGYSPQQQSQWSDRYSQCGGSSQSPIVIQTNKTVPTISEDPLVFRGYDRILPMMVLTNTGNTVRLAIHPSVNTNITQPPRISGGRLQSDYEFAGLHFHWGANNTVGAEHIIDGRNSPLEMHIVHRRIGSGPVSQQLVILGVTYQLEEWDGIEVAPIIGSLPGVRGYNTSVAILPVFNLEFFFGNINLNMYYEYTGSLTTPSCPEIVEWIVFRDRLLVSARQLNQLRQLMTFNNSGFSQRILENSRLPQPINGRTVCLNVAVAED